LRPSTKIVYEPAVESEARYLAGALSELLASKLDCVPAVDIDSAATDTIRLRIADVKVAGVAKGQGDEAYSLTILPNEGIEIVGSDPAGVFYGIESLRKLLPIDAYKHQSEQIEIEAAHIEDAPRFPYRGLHLDVARNFQSSQSVEKLLDLMAFYKLNRLHMHLTDDEGWRIEIKRLPELTDVGARRGHTLDEQDRLIPSQGSGPFPNAAKSPGSGFYSQKDFAEILRYAQARHIAVIPEIDFPGHARAAIKSMEVRYRRALAHGESNAEEFLLTEPGDASTYESVQMWRDNVADVGRDSTYRFLGVVFDELSEIYKSAGVPLTSIHLGGDEVPDGAWAKSPACDRIELDANLKTSRRGQLELHFLNRGSQLVAGRAIRPACWEDCLLLETEHDKFAGDTRRAAGKPIPIAYVWNNVWGWGREDAAYRLANAGFDVVLCNATNLYFDLAYEKDPSERGYYWAGFVGMRAPFEFIPFDVFKNASQTSMGQPVRADSFADRQRLTPDGTRHILGIQGELWGENLRDPKDLEYMAFPRVIALAERAWAPSPDWAEIEDPDTRRNKMEADWNAFANRLGRRELRRLDYLFGGVNYRLPPPGAVVRDGVLYANVAIPGLEIRYTLDGSEPTKSSARYSAPVLVDHDARLRSFSSGERGSRTVDVRVK
jgi:hexosaminidase